MPFNYSFFEPVGANSSNANAVYSYTTSEDLATVTSNGYFALKKDQLKEGDVVFLSSLDGNFVLVVTSDTSTCRLLLGSTTAQDYFVELAIRAASYDMQALNKNILNELRLMNTRIEAAFGTTVSENDIGEL